ncbi:MAG: DsbE family thiol:disulfide interchange protein [Candidatus Pelagibacter sp.]|nr:DsbE family thiol:disulfide interchange protein [Candidatus Pelagibacter sp.]
MKYFFLLIFMSSIGFLFYKGLKIDPSIVPSNLIDQETPDFQLKKIGNYPLFKPNDLKKKEIKIVNFFATWCGPCKIEHPQLMELSNSFKIYGIAKKDNTKDITKWLNNYGNPFNKVGLDINGTSSIEWGVYGLPETFIINKDNKILYKHIGPIMENDLEKINKILK